MENKFNLPTETVELPSKGLLYSPTSPLAEGKVEMKYMTAREEDILSNVNFIKDGSVLDRLLQSMIVTKINYNELLSADKDALLIAARILGYGKDYKFTYGGEEHVIDLTTLDHKEIDTTLYQNGNNFNFTLPASTVDVTFKLLNQTDEKNLQKELEGLKKISKNVPELSTRLKYIITSVQGDSDQKTIREFVDNYLLAKDSKALREYIKKIQPGVDIVFSPPGDTSTVNIPVGTEFFWPDA